MILNILKIFYYLLTFKNFKLLYLFKLLNIKIWNSKRECRITLRINIFSNILAVQYYRLSHRTFVYKAKQFGRNMSHKTFFHSGLQLYEENTRLYNLYDKTFWEMLQNFVKRFKLVLNQKFWILKCCYLN